MVGSEQATIDEARQIVSTAEPVVEQDAAEQERLRIEMMSVMEEMEATRARVGNFCISVEPQGENLLGGTAMKTDKAIVLAEPVETTRDFGGNQVRSREYVVVTPSGFRAIHFGVGMADGSEPYFSVEGYLDREQRLKTELAGAENGRIPPKPCQGYFRESDQRPQYPGAGEPREYIWLNGNYIGHQLIQVDGQVVTSALRSSIQKAQGSHRSNLTDVLTQRGIASAVRLDLPK